MFITLTSLHSSGKPKAMRVRADQIQIYYPSSTVRDSQPTHTEVEILGRAYNLQVEETVKQITALLASAGDADGATRGLVHEVRALRHDLESWRAGGAIRAVPQELHPTTKTLARLVTAVWGLDMPQFLSVGPVAEHLRMSPDELRNLYARAQELAK